MTDPTRLERRGPTAVLVIDNPPVNALSVQVRRGLAAGMAEALADPAVEAIVLTGAGRAFVGGADVKEFGRPPEPPLLPAVLCAIEDSRKPVVAAINGLALGGGLELALACHGRVAAPAARFGFPEVKLGLIPGAGGTQRLPRLVGMATALNMIVLAQELTAEAAAAAGLVDRLAEDADPTAAAVELARALAASGAPPRRVSDLPAPEAAPGLFDSFAEANARRFARLDAPAAAIEALKAAALPFDEGVRRERALFERLRDGPQSAALRHVFFAERQAAKVADLPADVQPPPIRSAGVVGAGTMGVGIAMALLNGGLAVALTDADPEALERAMGRIGDAYRDAVSRGRLAAAEAEQRLARLTPSPALGGVAAGDLVIEAVFEDLALKAEVFRALGALARPDAILASNTSYLDVDALAAAVPRPERVLGLHFFSPANVMRLMEVVRAARTSPEALASALVLARRIGKVPVVVGVAHGFVGNRMLARRQAQANRLILEGALPWEVDRVLTDFGFPMGPFQMADLAGLDIGWSRARSSSSTVREVLCEMDRRGQKTGAGFYDYGAARKGAPSPLVEQAVLDMSARLGIERRPIADAEILERCLYPMVNEGAQILADGKAQRASDIDVVWINGYGFPAWRGGPMFWAETVGLQEVVAALQRYAPVLGEDVPLSPLLVRLAEEKRSFGEL